MITPFNRQELLLTCEPDRFNRFRDVLAELGIDYQYRAKDLAARHRRGRIGSFGINDAARVEYRIFIRRKEYERVKGLLCERGIL